MATQHFAAAQYIEWLLRIVKHSPQAFTSGTQQQADKTHVNGMFNKTGKTRIT